MITFPLFPTLPRLRFRFRQHAPRRNAPATAQETIPAVSAHELVFDRAIATFKSNPDTWQYAKVCEAARDFKEACQREQREQKGESAV